MPTNLKPFLDQKSEQPTKSQSAIEEQEDAVGTESSCHEDERENAEIEITDISPELRLSQDHEKEIKPKAKHLESGAVIYKVRHKKSTFDAYWTSLRLTERDYDNQREEGAGLVLELRKDGYLSNPKDIPVDGKPVPLAKIVEEVMHIHSQHLIDIMPLVVGYYPSNKLSRSNLRNGHRSLVVARPYKMLGGARPKLQELKDQYRRELAEINPNGVHNEKDIERRAVTVQHIEILEHELDKVLKEPIAEELRGYHQHPSVASYDMLWLLFRPGTLVYTKIHEELACCMINIPFYNYESSMLELYMWFLDFDGVFVNRRSHVVQIETYTGKRPILQLEAYPVASECDHELKKRLINRGKKYMKYLQLLSPQCEYKGFVAETQEKNEPLKGRRFYEGKVIVDPIFYSMQWGLEYSFTWKDKRDVSSTATSLDTMAQYVDLDPRKPNLQLHETHFILLAAYIKGYLLGIRRWYWMHVDHLQDYYPDKKLIDSLAVDEEHLDMIKAFTPWLDIRQRADRPEPRPVRIDPINGKGEGQIMLFHGPPGTGKTFTVECIAEYSSRPLLRISVGELGLEPVELEEQLSQYFAMAEEWQAILLIDDVDIYLHQRGLGDGLKKEAIVVVFLRALEYYRGILFLTTNIVNKFDDAVSSRVSLIIQFYDLSPEQRKKLRMFHQSQINKDRRYELLGGAIEALKAIDKNEGLIFNGREIKTVFQMAVALAVQQNRERREDQRLSRESVDPQHVERTEINADHVCKVISNMRNYEAYQSRARGSKSREQAAMEQDRRSSSKLSRKQAQIPSMRNIDE